MSLAGLGIVAAMAVTAGLGASCASGPEDSPSTAPLQEAANPTPPGSLASPLPSQPEDGAPAVLTVVAEARATLLPAQPEGGTPAVPPDVAEAGATLLPAQPQGGTPAVPLAVSKEVRDPGPGQQWEPDPDFREALRGASFDTRGWLTDFSRHSVPFQEIFSGGPPRDGIPPIDNPKFATLEEGDEFLGPLEPAISFELNGEAKAYPLQILIWHEIVNDVVGGTPVAVTFCPLCNSAIVFDRRLDGVTHRFGTTGNLRNSDLIMWDRETESWWQQFTGEGIVGELTGKKLTFLPATIISWEAFKNANPDGQVLSRDTGFSSNYGENPYVGYDRVDNPPFLFFGDLDGRLPPKERVVSVTVGEVDAAFPFSVLEKERAVNHKVGDRNLAVFFKPGTVSALDGRLIRDSDDIGAAGLYDARLDGRVLTFEFDGGEIVDAQTGSSWNILGQAVSGPLIGRKLEPIAHTNSFWFAIGAFKPDSKIYLGPK